jgi:ABC-type glycerol-3-phosphate transport system substrate-binding protein
MKKIYQSAVVLLLFLFAALPVFSGGNRSTNSSGRTVVQLGIWPEDTLPAEIALHQEFVRIFNSRYPDVELQPAQYRYAVDTFVSMAEAGRVPTVFETWFTEPQKLISGGFVKDITAEIRALGWDTKMNPAVRDLLSSNGRIYGVPRDAYALGLMLNVELFREAGLVDRNGIPLYPKTWDELAQTAQIIKQRTGSAGLCLLAKDNAGGWHFTNIAWGFGANFMVERNGRWVAQVNSPEVAAALQYVKDLRWRYDVLTADPTNEDWSSGFRAIGTGAAAMYIAAADAVNQPTEVNGLPVGDLALVPIPAGPRGQFSLTGGTPYMFAANSSSAQIEAALRYLEIMGRSPVVDETTIAGLRADAQRRRNAGVPVIPDVPAWTDPALIRAKQDAIDAFKNVDDRLYADYFTAVATAGNLRSEEPMLAQDLYAELTKCLQAVLTDRNANVQNLLNTAQRNFQSLLDSEVNR